MSRPPVSVEHPRWIDTSYVENQISPYRAGTFQWYCNDAIRRIEEGDFLGARSQLELALEIEDGLPELWMLMAAVAYDAEEQIGFLENVLAYQPSNMVALEALATLRGDLDNKTDTSSQRPLQSIECTNCGGRLHYHVGDTNLRCHYCDHLVVDAGGLPTQYEGHTPLGLGILKRKNRPKDWNIGQRALVCDNCGASTTVTKQQLSNTCRFCGAQQVVLQGIQTNFEQPDLIVPFHVDEPAARESINQKLKSGIRALTRWFADPIAHIHLNAMYLPFWLFDGDMIVHWRWSSGQSGEHPVLVSSVPYFAAHNLSHHLLDIIEPFDLDQAVAYDARMLAQFPAELYSVDVDEASVKVRHKLNDIAMRESRRSQSVQAYEWASQDEYKGRLQFTPRVNYLSYRLGLLPVWVGMLVEEDGDWRHLLVNGQTGEVALGKLRKAS